MKHLQKLRKPLSRFVLKDACAATDREIRGLYDKIVHITVGPEKEDFEIHKGLLTKHSDYFRAALSGCFKEANEGVIVLEGEDVKAFAIFHTWLYTSKLVDVVNGEDAGFTLEEIARVYCLGDRYIVPGLKNTIIDRVIAGWVKEKGYPFLLVFNLYNQLPECDAMRKLLVDMFAWEEGTVLAKRISTMPDRFPSAFLENLVVAMAERPNPYKLYNAPWKTSVCASYHTHPDKTNCQS